VKDIKISSKEVLNQSQISVQESEIDAEYATDGKLIEVYDRSSTAMTYEEEYKAQLMWSKLQSETNFLSRRLCEKLRLVMEPLLATKLSGDYRTGKRINMKRVINYIASGYRKDKIWLRRKKPVKRSYRVLLAVDNSESMDKTGVGKLALTAMTILANGMSQLEIGELGIASFGEEMHLLHPFNKPFTYESGLSAVSNFRFNDRRTKTALCVESALVAMDSQNQGFHSSKKIFFIISDGRIERDSKVKLRQLVREMWEKNILLLMIIVEGKNKSHNKKESIITMKEITFENGIPRVKLFIEDYPFPYYIILDDINTLPEILGDALKQWFEMLLQCQKT
jgi:midasin